MTYNLYALTVTGIALGVIAIYCAAIVVISSDILDWKDQREAEARKLTYIVTLIIAIAAFGLTRAW